MHMRHRRKRVVVSTYFFQRKKNTVRVCLAFIPQSGTHLDIAQGSFKNCKVLLHVFSCLFVCFLHSLLLILACLSIVSLIFICTLDLLSYVLFLKDLIKF